MSLSPSHLMPVCDLNFLARIGIDMVQCQNELRSVNIEADGHVARQLRVQ